MEERNLVVVLLLSFITFGIYTLYWFYKTGKELRQRGKEIPNFILVLIPFVNLYYAYKYWKAAESITDLSLPLQAAVFLLIGPLYPALIQHKYNELNNSSAQPEQEEGGLLPLEDVEEDETASQEGEEEFSLDGLDEDLGEMEEMDFDEEDVDIDGDVEEQELTEEYSEEQPKEQNDDSVEEVEEVVEEVDELLKEGKEQQEITIKLRGEGRSDNLISQAYHVENERNNYE